MKTIILYYSLLGSTKALALKKGVELECETEEVIQEKKYNLFTSYILGAFKAMRRKGVPILPLKADLSQYDKIIIMSPVWAGHPAPAINSVIELLPAGKQVEFYLLSEGSGSKKTAQKTKEIAQANGCEVVCYYDVIKRNKGEYNVL